MSPFSTVSSRPAPVALALWIGCLCFAPPSCTGAAPPSGPTDPSASPSARRLYAFLESLAERDSKRVLAGQVFDKTWDRSTGFVPNVERLHDETGKWVAMLHSWLDYPWSRGRAHLSSDFIYPLYSNFHPRGAVLMLLVNPYNPWSGQGIKQDKHVPKGHSLSEVYTEGGFAYRVYREYLENLADNLERFAKDDIPIIIRLYGENNGKWFWFHHGADNVEPEEFRALWTYTVRHLRETRGLHNLLFCYEVTENRGHRLQGLVPELTDILGVQCGRQPFSQTLELYDQYLPYGKPIMMPQFLPMGKQSDPYDNLALIEGLKAHNPMVIGFSPWFTNGKRHAIVSNPNAAALMDHPWTATLEDTGLADPAPPSDMPVPRSHTEETRQIATGPFVWNFEGDDSELWTKRKSVLVLSEGDGRLNVFHHGEYPSILSPSGLGMKAARVARLRVRMRNHSTSTRASLRWITTEDADWNRDKSAALAIHRNPLDYSEYAVDLSENEQWKGMIYQVALFPALDSVTGSAEIDYIAFEKSE